MVAKRARNVLFITADQWRGDCLSALDHPCVTTPAIDELAREGVLFRRHYAQASPCGPARASLLTGMYMMNHRSVRNGTPLDARHSNLALEARKAGYEPTLFGYTDTSPDPRRYAPGDPALRSYEGVLPGMSVGLLLPADNMVAWIADLKAKGYDIAQGHQEVYRPVAGYPDAAHRGHSYSPTIFKAEDSETAFLTDAVLKHLSVHRKKGWFVHVTYLRPHPPIIAPEPYNALVDPAKVPMPVRAHSPEIEAGQHPYLDYILRNQREFSWYAKHDGASPLEIDETEIRQLRATYYGMIRQVDDQIGRLMKHLQATGEDAETLVIFTSDHGEMLGDHWMWGKEGYFDQAYHIPLVIRDPRPEGNRCRSRIVDKFTESIDIMPTILDWLGVDPSVQCDGVSLMPFVLGEAPAAGRREVHWEYDFRDILSHGAEAALGLRSDQCTLNVMRDNRFKYVHFTALPPLFFDLERDPEQFVNCATDPAYARLIAEFAGQMLSWRMVHDEKALTGMCLTEYGIIEHRDRR